jgi:hypothetical protein
LLRWQPEQAVVQAGAGRGGTLLNRIRGIHLRIVAVCRLAVQGFHIRHGHVALWITPLL